MAAASNPSLCIAGDHLPRLCMGQSPESVATPVIRVFGGNVTEGEMPGARLTFGEREEIAWRHDRKEGIRQIARAIGRSASTVSRELRRNVSPSPRRYRAFPAHIAARERARRARPRKLVPGSPVRAEVVRLLRLDYSPGQIAGRLRRDHPGEAAMRVSHETIYQALFVQGKGSLRAEVAEAVRCGRARKRRPRTGN